MVRLAPDVLVLDRYRVVAPPASPCAWGDVLLATDCLLGRYVDLVTAPAPLETPVGGHFARRAHAVAGARHPALPLVYDVATHDDYPVLVGQHIEGRALAHVIGAGAPWTAARALRLVERLSAALGEAHIQGLCHGAFSVDSVVLGWGDDTYIHDLAWPRGAAAHALEAAAPEVRAGAPPTRHSDVFALGYLLSQLLGGAPRTSNAPGVIEWAGTPVGVRDVLTRSMAPAPDNRYDNGAEMALAISAVLSRTRTVEHTQALPTISLAHTQVMPIHTRETATDVPGRGRGRRRHGPQRGAHYDWSARAGRASGRGGAPATRLAGPDVADAARGRERTRCRSSDAGRIRTDHGRPPTYSHADTGRPIRERKCDATTRHAHEHGARAHRHQRPQAQPDPHTVSNPDHDRP